LKVNLLKNTGYFIKHKGYFVKILEIGYMLKVGKENGKKSKVIAYVMRNNG